MPYRDREPVDLPVATDEQISQFQAEYQAAFNAGSQDELEGAKCRLIWALAHSSTRTNQRRGLDLAQAALENEEGLGQERQLRYYAAVAQYKMGHCLDARRTLAALLKDYPDYLMADALKAEVDDQVMKDGLIGLGLVGGVAALAIGLLLGGSRKH